MNPAWVREEWGAVLKTVTNFCASQHANFLEWLSDFVGF